MGADFEETHFLGKPLYIYYFYKSSQVCSKERAMARLNSSSSSNAPAAASTPPARRQSETFSSASESKLIEDQTFKRNATTCVPDKSKPFLHHLNPDNSLAPQLRVNGGELSPKSVVMDHFLDDTAQFPRRSNISIL